MGEGKREALKLFHRELFIGDLFRHTNFSIVFQGDFTAITYAMETLVAGQKK